MSSLLAGASAIQDILNQTQSTPVRVFVVWEPMLPADWSSPTRPVLGRVHDVRAAQFWDKNHLVAGELKNQLHGATPHCCENSGILWDMVALYPAGVRWTDAAPTFFDGPVWKVSLDLSKRLSEQR